MHAPMVQVFLDAFCEYSLLMCMSVLNSVFMTCMQGGPHLHDIPCTARASMQACSIQLKESAVNMDTKICIPFRLFLGLNCRYCDSFTLFP